MALVVILGGGESGYGSAVLALSKGYDVLLSDAGILREPYRSRMVSDGIPFEEGGHSLSKIVKAKVVVKSPGIPDTALIVREIREQGIPVISEIEFAGRYMAPHTRTIGITGSNGKTTTTMLIYEIMRTAGLRVELAGNVGRSLALQVAQTSPSEQPDWYIIELSSFQLDGMYAFRTNIALLLNITPDHLDRYDYRMERYVASKFRITQNMCSDDVFVYNEEDGNILSYLPEISPNLKSKKISFSTKIKDDHNGAWYDVVADELHYEDFTFSASEMRIKGLHNIANSLSAIVACQHAGISTEMIAQTLRTFNGVEHRMESVSAVNGVEYINDSKATNVDAVWYALQAMTRPTVWIAGGEDKGNDYEVLKPLVREHVKALVCMGLNNEKLVNSFTGIVPIYDTASLDEAMAVCKEVAESADVVLLSPACASFDLFKNYEDRGDKFKEAALKNI